MNAPFPLLLNVLCLLPGPPIPFPDMFPPSGHLEVKVVFSESRSGLKTQMTPFSRQGAGFEKAIHSSLHIWFHACHPLPGSMGVSPTRNIIWVPPVALPSPRSIKHLFLALTNYFPECPLPACCRVSRVVVRRPFIRNHWVSLALMKNRTYSRCSVNSYLVNASTSLIPMGEKKTLNSPVFCSWGDLQALPCPVTFLLVHLPSAGFDYY